MRLTSSESAYSSPFPVAPQGLATLQACVWMGEEKYEKNQEDHYFIYDFVDKQNQTLDWTPSKGLDFPLHHLVCHNVNQVHHNVTMSPCQSRWSYVTMSIKLIPCSFNLTSISNLVCNISPPGPTGVPLNLCVWDPKKVDLFFPVKRSRGEYLSK